MLSARSVHCAALERTSGLHRPEQHLSPFSGAITPPRCLLQLRNAGGGAIAAAQNAVFKLLKRHDPKFYNLLNFQFARYLGIPIMFEEPLVAFGNSPGLLNLVGATIIADPADFTGIHHAARALAEDFGRVTRGRANPIEMVSPGQLNAPAAIIIGCIESCWMIQELQSLGKIEIAPIRGQWESFTTFVVDKPLPGCARALIIAGSDKRGAIFGTYTLSSQIGVSPYVKMFTR